MKRLLVAIVLSFGLGLLLGAAAIHRPIPKAPVELPPARNPLKPADVLGLIGSIGIRGLSGHLEHIPSVVAETDRTFALSVPDRRFRFHYVIVPKKDIHDAGQISAADEPYLTEIFLMARHLAEKDSMKSYRLYTNSGGLQTVGYLHFHMVGWRKWGDDR
jgi:diadenosine tetraphosphate (Ap4A) HIT family hydrolase